MDRPKNYAKCYAILGVFPDDDWTTVRNAYQRQIKRWHPDRFQDGSYQELALEKTKELNSAYHELNDYHRRFGVLPWDGSTCLPADALPEHKTHTDDQSGFQPADTWGGDTSTYTASVTPKRRRFGGPAAAVTVLALGYLVWGGEWFTTPEYEELGYAQYDTTGLGKDASSGLSGQLSGSDHTAIRTGNTQSYSKQDKSRKAIMPASPQSHFTYSEMGSLPTGSFGRDSFKQDVLVAQGPPHHQTEHVWYYGSSRVFFRYGKVSGWYESPSNPLNAVREDSGKLSENDSPPTSNR